MRKCSKCQVEKELSEFYSKGKSLHSYCKPCLHKAQMKRWKLRKVKAIKLLGNRCQDCNNQYPPEVYQFHHITPSEKDFDWGRARLLSWDKIEVELRKCCLLCANCHIMRHSVYISNYDS